LDVVLAVIGLQVLAVQRSLIPTNLVTFEHISPRRSLNSATPWAYGEHR